MNALLEQPLVLYGCNISYFTGKLENYFRLKGVPYRLHSMQGPRDFRLAQEVVGVSQMPFLQLADGRWMTDTTKMIQWFDSRYPVDGLLPDDPLQAFLCLLLEDWADESLYFYEMHLRFTTPGNRERNIPRMVEHESAFLRWLLPRVIPGGIQKITASQGIGRKSTEQLMVDVERHVQAIDGLLDGSDWLVGDRLTLADLAVYAMFQALRDADMALTLLQSHPAVTAWMARIEETTSQRANP